MSYQINQDMLRDTLLCWQRRLGEWEDASDVCELVRGTLVLIISFEVDDRWSFILPGACDLCHELITAAEMHDVLLIAGAGPRYKLYHRCDLRVLRE